MALSRPVLRLVSKTLKSFALTSPKGLPPSLPASIPLNSLERTIGRLRQLHRDDPEKAALIATSLDKVLDRFAPTGPFLVPQVDRWQVSASHGWLATALRAVHDISEERVKTTTLTEDTTELEVCDAIQQLADQRRAILLDWTRWANFDETRRQQLAVAVANYYYTLGCIERWCGL